MLFSSVMILFSGGHESEAHGVTHPPLLFGLVFFPFSITVQYKKFL